MESELGAIALYELEDGSTSIEVRFAADSVWLTQQQLSSLFGRDITVIRRHISNARKEELVGISTSAKFALVQLEGGRTVTRHVEHYNLDMVLSIGYRVKSPQGARFRQWANEQLKSYVLQGYAVNEQRLRELGQVATILSRSVDALVSGSAEIVSTYLPGLTMLREYDNAEIDAHPTTVPHWKLTIEEAREVIANAAEQFTDDSLFGNERGQALQGVVEAIYQGFAGQEIYPTVEEKAANLLYLVVKDHPLTDGNKRSAAALFVTFLAKNNILFDASGERRISNNALTAITLMVAMSEPREKDLMVTLITRMLSERNTFGADLEGENR